MSHLFEVKNLFKTYGEKETEVHALSGIDLTISKGEFTAVVGPSGSGKTTFLNIISGLDHPTVGEVFLKNIQMNKLSNNELADFRRDHIGFIFQAYNLIPVLNVKENIEYVMVLQGISPKERIDRVRSILSEVGLSGKEKRF